MWSVRDASAVRGQQQSGARTDGNPGGAAEDDDVEQRVGAEAVGAVHAGRGGLAGGQQAVHYRVWVLLRRIYHLQQSCRVVH